MAANVLARSAAWYGAHSMAVVPLNWVLATGACSCLDATCESIGKHPLTRTGLTEASMDERNIAAWWTRWPNANIGIVTGPSNLVVLDVDPKNGGDDSFTTLHDELGGATFETVSCLTGGGGEHYYFRSGETRFRNSASLLGPGLDIRADGGYVVAPPSNHASGTPYRWEVSSKPSDMPMALLPKALEERLLRVRAKPKSFAVASDVSADVIPDGQRDNTLTSLAGILRRRGLHRVEILAALQSVNARRCNPPLPDNDLRRIAWSIARYDPAQSLNDAVENGRTAELAAIAFNPEQAGLAWMRSLLEPPENRRYATGLSALDAVLKGGLRPGELTVIGAWTGVGKSGFAEQAALEIAKSASVLFLPLELGVERTERRMLAKLTATSEDLVSMLERSDLQDHRQRMLTAIEDLQSRHLSMFAPGLDEAFKFEHVEKLIVQQKPEVLVIDHLQHLDDWVSAGPGRADVGPANIVKRLRRLIATHKVHVICVHQLKAEKIQKSQRPQIYDFADTAALARVADTIIMLHRPLRGTPEDAVMEILILKNRRGPEPWLHVRFVGDSVSMESISDEEAAGLACCAS